MITDEFHLSYQSLNQSGLIAAETRHSTLACAYGANKFIVSTVTALLLLQRFSCGSTAAGDSYVISK